MTDTDHSSESVTPCDTDDPRDPPYIWYGPLARRFPTRQLWMVRGSTIMLTLLAVAAWLVYWLGAPGMMRIPISSMLSIAIVLTVFAIIFWIKVTIMLRQDAAINMWSMWPAVNADEAISPTSCGDVLRKHGLHRLRAANPKFTPDIELLRRELAACLDAPVRTLVDEYLRPQLVSIPLDVPMRELENVASGPAYSPRAAKYLVPLFVVFSLLNLITANWLAAIAMIAFAVIAAYSLPAVRTRLGALPSFTSNQPIVGEGAVMDQKGRRWTIRDSILLARQNAGNNRIYATFVGPEGSLEFFYHDVEDENFQLLWQQWNLPNARPELMD